MPHANSLLLPVSYTRTRVLLQFLPQFGDSSMVNSIYPWDIPTGICNKRRNLAILLYAFFRVVSRSLNFICRRFGALCSTFIGGLWRLNRRSVPYTIQTPGNYPEESIQHSEHGESLKSAHLAGQWTFLSRDAYIEIRIFILLDEEQLKHYEVSRWAIRSIFLFRAVSY
jgi:hypothetical protein